MTITMSDVTHAFYVPGSLGAIDAVHPKTGRGLWGGRTFEEIKAENPGAIIERYEVIENFIREMYREAPAIIDADRWDYALNVLPPVAWITQRGAETFHISELLTHDIASIYCRIGDRYFIMNDSIALTHDEIVTACQKVTK